MTGIDTIIRQNYSSLQQTTISLLRQGPDNDVFLITNKNNKKIFVVRVSKRNIAKEDAIFETSWLIKLKEKGIPVPQVIKTKSNKYFFIDKNKQLYVAFKYVEGKHIQIQPHTKPLLHLITEAAKTLSKLHNASLDINLNLPRKRNILTEINRALTIKNKFIQSSPGGKQFVYELTFYKNWAKKHLENNYLVHNDYRPGNVLFNNNQVIAVLDFDWSCRGPAIKDVAHALVEWSFPDGAKKHWQDVFLVFLKSYNKEAKNKIQLNSNLYHWICFSCLSDAATYLTDLAHKKVFKPITYSYMYQKFLYFQHQHNLNSLP